MSLAIDVTADEPVTVLRLTGSVDSLTAADLLQALSVQIQATRVRLVADFSDVAYTSSAGLRTLLATLKDARRQGGDLRLACVQPPVHKVLELSGFTSILQLYPDVGAACASFDNMGTA